MLRFELLGGDAGGPRRARLTLDHGVVETPAFMPVGTAGTVKAARWSDLERRAPKSSWRTRTTSCSAPEAT